MNRAPTQWEQLLHKQNSDHLDRFKEARPEEGLNLKKY